MARVQLTGLLLATPVLGAVVGEPKKPYADRDDGIPREHVEENADRHRDEAHALRPRNGMVYGGPLVKLSNATAFVTRPGGRKNLPTIL